MPASEPTILATSMGFAGRNRGPYDWRPGPVFDLAFELAGAPDRPRLCYLGTATGDDPARVAGVYVCGDHRDTPSIQGAMASGARAARAVLRALRPSHHPPRGA